MTTLPPLPTLVPPPPRQPVQVSWHHTASFVRVVISGHVSPDELMNVVRQIAADAPSWVSRAVLIDLSPVCARLGFMQHLLIGQEIADCLDHCLDKVAVLTGRDLPAMERAACGGSEQAEVRFFLEEEDALDWLLSVELAA